MSNLVLVTGSAGRVGRAAVAELVSRGHRVRGFDLVESPGVTENVLGTAQSADAVRAAMRDVTSLIHLAATPDDAPFESELVPNNIIRLHHVMEAAREAGVARVILASSGQVNDRQQIDGPWPVRTTDPISPRYWYAATKAFMESIGFSYAQRHGMTVIATRLGWCPRTQEQEAEIAAEERFRDIYLSPGDAGRFYAGCIEANVPSGFHILFGASRPVRTERLELAPARALIGYTPLDQWPAGLR